MRRLWGRWILCVLVLTLAFSMGHAVAAEDGEQASSYTRMLARKNQEFMSGDAVILGELPVQEAKDYTLMVYMIGSNLESKLGSASADVEEMEESGLDFESTNLILYTGGSARWFSDVPCDRNCVIDMSRQGENRVVAGTAKNADMGAFETLAAFVNFCTEKYPAEHYGLILWDHGGGPLWGYGADELFQGDGLLLSEMQLAMERTVFSESRKLDFVGFDACLMGNLETMAVWAPYAEYFVASEELEPGDGWDYHFLKALNQKSKDAVKVTTAIVQSYEKYYKANQTQYFHPDVTLSVTKLSEIREVQATLANAALVMTKDMEHGQAKELFATRAKAKSFGMTGRIEDGTQFYYDLVDMGSFAEEFKKRSETEGKEMLAALKQFVVKNYSNVEGASGVTFYYPANNRMQYHEMRETYEKLGLNREYGDFIKSVGRSWLSSERQDFDLAALTLNEKGTEYVLSLTEEQAAAVVNASASILVREESGEFWAAMDRIAAYPDENGVIQLPGDPKLVTLETSGTRLLWPTTLAEDSAKRRVYHTVRTRLLSSGESIFQRPAVCYEDVTVILQGGVKGDSLTVKAINSISEDAQGAGKESIDVSHYDSIFYYYSPKIPAWDADGNFLPYEEWRQSSDNRSGMQTLEERFGFSLLSASQLSEDLYYVVTLEDEGGQLYVTEPVKIEPARKYEIYRELTEQGELIYQLYKDHATLLSYTGTDTHLELPNRVQNRYVTEIAPYAFSDLAVVQGADALPLRSIRFPNRLQKIGAGAFQNCVSLEVLDLPSAMDVIGSKAFYHCIGLKEVKLPSGIRTMGAYVFAECSGLNQVTLPSNVNTIGKGVFACCESLEKIVLSSANSHYKMTDGALYTKSGKLLLSVPAKKTGSFTVGKETKKIASDCFSYSRLSEVVLPEGLETIENYAFYGAISLRVPAFPESLRSVGRYAFYAGWNQLKLSEAAKGVQEIRIGKNVTTIGREAFAGFVERRFSVDAENLSFSERDGALLNKAGDAILEFAANGQNTFLIPEGVKVFDLSILEQIGQDGSYVENPPYHVYVPDSVMRFTGRTTFLWDVVLHCNPGSAAEQYAQDQEINVSYEWDPIERELTKSTPKGNLTYQLTAKKAILVHYEGTDEELVLPEEVAGRPVLQIGNGMKGLVGALTPKTVKRVVLPKTTETIAAHAFEYFGEFACELPEGVKVIGDQAFAYCSVPFTELPKGLLDLGAEALGSGCDFSGGVTIPSGIQRIAPGAFHGIAVPEFRMEGENPDYAVRDGMLYAANGRFLLAARLPGADGKLTVPEGTEVIGTLAFSGLPVTEVSLPSSVTLIAQYAFAYCTQLQAITLPEGLQNIGSYSFVYTGFKQLELPKSCTRIGTAAFFGSYRLEKVAGAPQIVEPYAFAYCQSLWDVAFSEGLTEIGDCAFYQTAVTSVSLPDSLYLLGAQAFASDTPGIRSKVMKEMTIGSKLSHIGENAFGGLSISQFVVASENACFAVTDGFLTDKARRRLFACPVGMTGEVTIPDEIHEIAPYALYDCEYITMITIPETVDVIGQNAFCDHVPEGGAKGSRPILRCKEGSAAYVFAVTRNWPYLLDVIDDESKK
ncbi:MAG: leucine-rich repeat protein [Lachnospiraceae bacterium]|nr:leucine-rich repeat protein [Lachnospiraceae bacterium]